MSELATAKGTSNFLIGSRVTIVTRLLSVLLMALFFLAPITVSAQVPVPELTGPVIDTTGVLGESAGAIANQLEAFRVARGTEIVVLIVSSTKPETIEQFSIRVADTWKIGRKGIDDGAILVVAVEDRTVRIEVGRGLEGDIPDVIAFRIIQEIILPRFREQDIAAGVAAGVQALTALASGVDLPPPTNASDEGIGPLPLLFFVFLFGSILASLFGSLVGAVSAGAIGFGVTLIFSTVFSAIGIGVLASLLVLFRNPILSMLGNSSSGGYRGGGYGGGGFGGGWSSGGGFGSGGGFSGGGASGRW